MKYRWIFAAIIILLVAASAIGRTIPPTIMSQESLDAHTGPVDPTNAAIRAGNGSTGIVIIHGFGQTPYQAKNLAAYLAKNNITVSVPLLPGHGTNLTDFEQSTKEAWFGAAKSAADELKETTDTTYILGVSSGALLALEYAAQEDIDGVIVIAPPIYLQDKLFPLMPLLALFQRYHHAGVEDSLVGHAYENLPLASLLEFKQLIEDTKKNLHLIDESALVLQSRADATVKPASAEYVFNEIRSGEKDLVYVSEAGHALIRPYEGESSVAAEERVTSFEQILEFIR